MSTFWATEYLKMATVKTAEPMAAHVMRAANRLAPYGGLAGAGAALGAGIGTIRGATRDLNEDESRAGAVAKGLIGGGLGGGVLGGGLGYAAGHFGADAINAGLHREPGNGYGNAFLGSYFAGGNAGMNTYVDALRRADLRARRAGRV
jgi:hypothetical protein